MIGLSAAVIPLQYANAVNNDDDKTSSCRHNLSDTSKNAPKKIHLSFSVFLSTKSNKKMPPLTLILWEDIGSFYQMLLITCKIKFMLQGY
jgi:hypothetical protein